MIPREAIEKLKTICKIHHGRNAALPAVLSRCAYGIRRDPVPVPQVPAITEDERKVLAYLQVEIYEHKGNPTVRDMQRCSACARHGRVSGC